MKKKLYTVTKGYWTEDGDVVSRTWDTDDESETKADAPYVVVRLNVAIDGRELEKALNALDT